MKRVPRDAWHAGVGPAESAEGARRASTRCGRSAQSVAPNGPVPQTFEGPKKRRTIFWKLY